MMWGKRAKAVRDLHLNDVMTRAPKTVRPSHHLFTVKKLMNELGIRHLPVVEGDEIHGVISDRDIGLVERVFKSRSDRSIEVQELCLMEPVVLDERQTVSQALDKMLSLRIGSILVTKNKRLSGIFTMIDAAKLLQKNLTK